MKHGPERASSALALLLTSAALLPLSGCLVMQPQGLGKLERRTEPATGRAYFLYLPKDYLAADESERAARRWPLVVTFHGMKPYDTALYQGQEWQQEADRYGYIVVAPHMYAFDFFTGEFPLRTINKEFKADEIATLAVMDHVLETTHADPENVLATSWSSGGYMAHYMLNRHPERFSALAVRQSNFSASILDPVLAVHSLYHPVLVLGTENDLEICKRESREAIKWYEGLGYKNFAWIYMNRLGHARTPDTAADFFARVSGVSANRPPEVLTARQAIDGNPAGLALLAGRVIQIQKPPPALAAETARRRAAHGRPTPPRAMVAATLPTEPSTAPAPPPREPLVAQQRGVPTPPRGEAGLVERPPSAVGIRLSATAGFEPLLVAYSAECPADWHRTADFYWLLDGRAIGQGLNGQRLLAQPGEYVLELLVVTPDGVEHRAERSIRVLRNMASAAPVR